MDSIYGKLELTWPNKDKTLIWDQKIQNYRWVSPDHILAQEVRILKEKDAVGEPNSIFDVSAQKWSKSKKSLMNNEQSSLIMGDNLLSLRSLEQDFTNKIKLVYIDPPFNTGTAFEHYDDGLEHSIWMSLMKTRLEILHKLLRNDGSIFVHIDQHEKFFLKAIMDEIFNPSNFRNEIIVKRTKKNFIEKDKIKSVILSHDSILVYAKSDETEFHPPFKKVKREERWHGFDAPNWAGTRPNLNYKLFGHSPPKGTVWRWTKERSMKAIKDGRLRKNPRTGKPEYKIDASEQELMGTIWDDNNAYSFHWDFQTEKNEYLLKRIIEMATEPNEWVLDSFAGSGTTGAVAHKLGRKWILVETKKQAETHCLKRLREVVDGSDKSGISKEINWKGGGGLRYYVLGESLFKLDEDGTKQITFDNGDLIEAICKNEGFKFVGREFLPKTKLHGVINNKRFCHVAEELVIQDYLEDLKGEIKEDESLVVYCMKKMSKLDIPPNIEVKKIPRDISKRFTFE